MPMATEALRLRSHLATLKMEVALVRWGLAIRAFNPNQSRVPAGNPDGGQWTTEYESVIDPLSDDARLVFVDTQDDRQYSVDLREEEDRGGHALSEHVGKTDADMMQRVRRERWDSFGFSSGRQRDGSFSSVETANDFVNRTLESNTSEVNAVAEGRQDDAFLKHRFGYRTGREAYSKDGNEPYMRDTYSVGV